VEKEVSAKGIGNDKVEAMKYASRRGDHRRGMTDDGQPKVKVIQPKVDRKGKGKAIDTYEQAGPSRITEIVDSAPSGSVSTASGSFCLTGLSAYLPPITTIDDDATMGFTLGLIAPPKSILKRCASESEITSSAI